MKENLDNLIKQIKGNKELEHYLSAECDVDFESKEVLEDNLSFFMENGIIN